MTASRLTVLIFPNHSFTSPVVSPRSRCRSAAICVLTLGDPTWWIAICTAPASWTSAPRASLWPAPVENAVLRPARKLPDWGATIPVVTPERYASLRTQNQPSHSFQMRPRDRYSQGISRAEQETIHSLNQRARPACQTRHTLGQCIGDVSVVRRPRLVDLKTERTPSADESR